MALFLEMMSERTGVFLEKMMMTDHVFVEKMMRFPGLVGGKIWEVGRDDPRRVIHALKVGFALTTVSLLYLMEPLFKGVNVGENAIWAVMTVVVVLEFNAGAVLCKGINRGFGTLLAASLAFLFEFIAQEYGKVFQAVFIGASIFVIGALSTYLRFFPAIKKNYDYGVVVFLLTFNLITVSSYRVDEILKLAQARIYTIAIGSGVCILMSFFIFPNWSGEDLHNSTVSKIEGLATSIQACVNQYFNDEEPDIEGDIYDKYKAVLDSKSTDETLAQHASWEPRPSWLYRKFPWQQYVKLGGVLRHFGYAVVALHGSLQIEIGTPRSVRLLFKDPCIQLASEVTAALMELAGSIRNQRHCSREILAERLHHAQQDLDMALKSRRKQLAMELSEAALLPFVALLLESVARLDLVIEEVQELGRVACFKEFKHDDNHVILDIEEEDGRRTTKINLISNSTE